MSAASGAPLARLPSGRRYDVVGLGQISADLVARMEGFPSPGAKCDLESLAERAGGQVATAVLGCARLGLRTALVGRIGDDAAGASALGPLREAGVDLREVRTVAGAGTRRALVLVDSRSGERTVLAHRDPRLALSPAEVPEAWIEAGRVLLVDAEDPAASAAAAEVARRTGAAVVLDADRPRPEIDALLARVDFPLVGRAFSEGRHGPAGEEATLRDLLELGARLAAVTLGEGGVLVGWKGHRHRLPAFPVDVVDTTGAGDAFRAGFVWALCRGLGPLDAVRAAQACAALNCRAEGAQGGLPEAAELTRFLARANAREEGRLR